MILNMYNTKDNSSVDNLKKSKGIKLIRKYLPHLDANRQCYIVNTLEEWNEIKDKFPEIVTCRTDTRVGTDMPNIHGATRKKEDIADYIIENREKVDNPYFICLELEPNTNERIYTKGGFLLIFENGKDIKIGYVGPGFDCGSCCKGEAEHETWTIPWEKSEVYRKDAIERYHIQKTTQSNYIKTAIKRMAFLIKEYPYRKKEIMKVFPKRYLTGIDPKLFEKMQQEVLIPLWERQEELSSDGLNTFGVELNVVENNRIVPFEIEVPENFKVMKDDYSKLYKTKSKAFSISEKEKKRAMIYGKAKGIVLLEKYLPNLNPFSGIKIISSKEEWEKVKDDYPDRLTSRTDTAIGDPRIVRIDGTTGKKEDISETIDEIKRQNPDGVLLILNKKTATVSRYKYDGGFNVAFNEDDYVIIELVGKGFDGSDLTRGRAVHERYVIPWNDVLFMRNKSDLIKNRNVNRTLIDSKDYKKTIQERLKFLKDINEDVEEAKRYIPEEYKESDDELIKSILDDVIQEVYEKKSELHRDGLRNFSIQGNIVNGRVEPWEIFKPERLITKSKER